MKYATPIGRLASVSAFTFGWHSRTCPKRQGRGGSLLRQTSRNSLRPQKRERQNDLAYQIAPGNAGRQSRLHSDAIGPACLRFPLDHLRFMDPNVFLMRFVCGRPTDLSTNDLLPVSPPAALIRRDQQGFQARLDDGAEIEFSTVVPSGVPHPEYDEITFSDELSQGYCTENLARHTDRPYVWAGIHEPTRQVAELIYELSQRTRALIVVFGTNDNMFMHAGVTTYPAQKEDLPADWVYSVMHCASAEELFRLFSRNVAGLRRYQEFFERQQRYQNIRGGYGAALLESHSNSKQFSCQLTDAMKWRHLSSPDSDYGSFLIGLTAGEKSFVLVDDFFNRVHWSGFYEYLVGKSCQDTLEVLRALDLLGFSEAAAFLTGALRNPGGGGFSGTWGLAQHWSSADTGRRASVTGAWVSRRGIHYQSQQRRV
jgi:hypothetical protein